MAFATNSLSPISAFSAPLPTAYRQLELRAARTPWQCTRLLFRSFEIRPTSLFQAGSHQNLLCCHIKAFCTSDHRSICPSSGRAPSVRFWCGSPSSSVCGTPCRFPSCRSRAAPRTCPGWTRCAGAGRPCSGWSEISTGQLFLAPPETCEFLMELLLGMKPDNLAFS